MQLSEFLAQVQDRAQLPSKGHALAATRATLVTLGERLAGGEPQQLAAQLPQEVAHFLTSGKVSPQDSGQRFDLAEFFQRVARQERVSPPQAAGHAQAVLGVLREAASPGELDGVRSQLPEDICRLLDGGQPIPEGVAASAASASF